MKPLHQNSKHSCKHILLWLLFVQLVCYMLCNQYIQPLLYMYHQSAFLFLRYISLSIPYLFQWLHLLLLTANLWDCIIIITTITNTLFDGWIKWYCTLWIWWTLRVACAWIINIVNKSFNWKFNLLIIILSIFLIKKKKK